MDKKLVQQLTEYGQNLSTGGINELAIANVIALVISELETKPAPEAYMGYALYDADSNLYEQGKVVLSKKARNKHEELIEKIAIKNDGYIETFLVNETSENVWFDQFRIMSTGPLIVQETHYDPWGVDLSGLGYQYGGIKVNPYLYNGKELTSGLGVIMYDYGARLYIPAIGRWFVPDPLAEKMRRHSPYTYAFNNPIRFIDPDGMEPYSVQGTVVIDSNKDVEDETTKSVVNREEVMVDTGYGQMVSSGDVVGVDYSGNFETKSKKKSENEEACCQNGENDGPMAAATTIALGAATADGPIPIGDVIGGVILAAATAYDATQRTFITYTMRNAAGQTYVGRTSGYGDPNRIMMNRASGHHMKALGYGNPVLDRAVQGYQGYPAIRGREQQLIDFHGGAGNIGVGNSIRGVSRYNPAYPIYHGASTFYFGSLWPYTGF